MPGPAVQSFERRADGFWSHGRLEKEIDSWAASGLPLFEPYNPLRRIKSSYQMSVGDEVYITPASEDEPQTRQRLARREARVIPSGQFAFLITEERVRVPSNAIAFISLRSKATKFRGLVNVSGFHVDPGYHGRLIFSVFNAGPGPIQVARGDVWFEIFFADLSIERGHHEDLAEGYEHIETSFITPVSDQFQSLAGLQAEIKKNKEEMTERLHRIEREHSVARWAAVLFATVLLTIGVRSWLEDQSPAKADPIGQNGDAG